MQSGYGGDMQQFMVDGSCPPSFFSISPPPNLNSSSSSAAAADIQNQQKLYHQPPPPHHLPLPPLLPHFSHSFHPTPPMTQQLFHHPHPHFQFFHPTALDSSPSPASAAPGPSFLAPAMSFKLGVRDSCVNEDDGSESRLHSWPRDEEESAATIKQPFWRPLDMDYISRNNKRPKSPENNDISSKDNIQANTAAPLAAAGAGSNYKLFSELEAIYKPGSSSCCTPKNNNQTGSGSALTGDDAPVVPELDRCPVAIDDDQPDHESDTSDGGDAAPPTSRRASSGRRKRQVERMGAIAAFFDGLVKRVMDHQETLHCKFLQFMERREHERASREEAWRKETALTASREAASRAHETALAASREAAIVTFLEKITGESLDLPRPYNADVSSDIIGSSSRWPKAEVQALIRVRSGLEPRFQEPGLKGPLWEEVSAAMATAGYRRSSKRCKEKWENINKYFRKTKDSGKKRPRQSKTCPYFHQLDQLYSKPGTPPSSSNAGADIEKDKHSPELLEAVAASSSATTRISNSGILDMAMQMPYVK